MNDFVTFVQNKYIYVPFFLWFGIQLFKLIYDLFTTKKFNFKRIMGAGGMPSSHSAVVAGLATLIGKYEGVGTPIFAVALIVAFVVMYDACGVRRAAGKQASLLNKLIETPRINRCTSVRKIGRSTRTYTNSGVCWSFGRSNSRINSLNKKVVRDGK